ncbi:MAG: RNA polymerase sigma factor [Planctomycetes bacterium]|nr:RNA polymerase sigma factor [Planctomycetota bacterium]
MTPSDHPTSATLLDRARNNDAEAWRRLVHLYGPLVDRWCAHKGVYGPDAEDVRQEVFRAVAANLSAFRRDRAGDTFRGWLRAITRHKLLDHFRARSARPEAQGGTDAHHELQNLAEPNLPEDTEEDLGALYRRALELVRSEFEVQTWQAFWRAAVEGHAPADIAADLGVTPAAVRKAKSRVLLRLRQELGDVIA